MDPSAAPWTGFRRAALPLTLVLLLLPATAVRAQRLLTLVPGVAAPSTADDLGPSIGPVPTAVQVDLDLLRSGPAWLETPTPDGSVLRAERSVFEDRGNGDLMWSGGHPDAGYDTVVLTVEGGRLVGRFAAAGGGAYQIHAERDGRGGMSAVGGPRPLGPDGTPVPFCAVETAEPDALHAAAHARVGAPAAEPPRRVAEPQSHDRLDILVAYTATAAENWADRGGAMAAIRHAGDYLKMVFRNNELPVEPHIVHVAQASAVLDRARRELGPRDALINRLRDDGDLLRLRHEHRADLVHLFTGEGPALHRVCGQHFLLVRGRTARTYHDSAYGWTSNDAYCDYVATFVHEIGHGLGADHDPPTAGSRERLIRPYAFGHANWHVMPNIGTAMSNRGQIEPFFSTSRIRPWGATVGIADERDNERLLRETVHVGARYSDYLRSLEGVPAPPSNVRIWIEGAAARLSWQDNAPDADGYEVRCVDFVASEYIGRRVTSRSGATIPLVHLEPGAEYECHVMATKGEERSLRSSYVYLVILGEPPEAPSDVRVDPTNAGLRVHWTDNSDDASGFEVLLYEDGEPVGIEWASANETTVWFRGDDIEPRDREYEVRVYATHLFTYSDSSEPVTFRWRHPLAPAPVADLVATAIGPTTVRLTWTGNPESGWYEVRARLEGWEDGSNVPEATGHVDFEGLARGGRYEFEVRGWNEYGGSVSSRTRLTLGARGAGPQAPSDLAWFIEGDRARLSWKDNSLDELGFEVQTSSGHRLALLPPDAESAVVSSGYFTPGFGGVKVFAYNERGFSAGSAHVPRVGLCVGPATETLCLRDSRFQVNIRWRPAGGEWSAGQVVDAGAEDSGLFHFGDPENWEVLLKVLDGCAINGRMWVLGASTTDLEYRLTVRDTVTGDWRRYRNASGQPAPAIVDAEAFSGPCRATAPAVAPSAEVSGGEAPAWLAPSAEASPARVPARLAGQSEAGGTTLYLLNGRFQARVSAVGPAGERHEGQVARIGTNKSGLFYFFDPENWEVLLKVLDGCGINGHYWVLAASATDLGLDLRVEDAVIGRSKRYGTEPGQPAPAIVDTEALACAAGAATQ